MTRDFHLGHPEPIADRVIACSKFSGPCNKARYTPYVAESRDGSNDGEIGGLAVLAPPPF